MNIGFSSCHLHQLDEDFVLTTLDRLDHLDYQRFEISHEHFPQKRGLGAIDDFIQYPILEKLNDKKMYDPERLGVLRRALGRVKQSGRETALWSHELATPKEVLDEYPELRTPKGDIDLSHPLLTEWLSRKYETFFQCCPEIDAIVLVMTEVRFPVAHRFDNKWSPAECIHWLIRTIHDACVGNGKKLIVRPFSAIVADYQAAHEALQRLPSDIEIMLKSDPFDWNPFLPLNPDLSKYPPEQLTVEFDLGSEYFGRGTLPVIYPDYLRKRLDHVKNLGIGRVIGRVDRKGVSALDREGRLNVDFFYHYARNAADAVPLSDCAARYYKCTDYEQLLEQMEKAFEVVKHTFYVDGQLLWHNLYGDLNEAQRALLFEVLRSNISLEHGCDEWHLLSHKTTPSTQEARDEKDRALTNAESILKAIRRVAPSEESLIQRARNLVQITRLYRDSVVLFQEYLSCLDTTEIKGFEQAGNIVFETAQLLAANSDPIFQNIARKAERNVEELRELLPTEEAIYRTGAADGVVDVIAVGYPGEGHAIQKFTHGSSCKSENGQRFRAIQRYLSYRLDVGDGRFTLKTRCKGAATISIRSGDLVLAERRFDSTDWQDVELGFDTGVGTDQLRVRIDKAGETPALMTIHVFQD